MAKAKRKVGPGRQTSPRAGRYIKQPEGYYAFIPKALPPKSFEFTASRAVLLAQAERALGRVAESCEILPDPDLFVSMYIRREAVLSSQIEGTRASLNEILEFEAEAQVKAADRPPSYADVFNYVDALSFGLERVKEFPLSLRLIREIHGHLMRGVRGGEPGKAPGEFRKTQNCWGGSGPHDALFVPPPQHEMMAALDGFERFIQGQSEFPLLVKVGLAHSQFESIHPFVDGNGRMGRLLISFLLSYAGILRQPMLYLSIYFKENRDEYFGRLQDVRDHGNWEEWIDFFLKGVAIVGHETATTTRKIVALREKLLETIDSEFGRGAGNASRLAKLLFSRPYIRKKQVQACLRISQPAASSLVNRFEDRGILVGLKDRKRNRMYRFERYLELFHERDARS